MGQKGFLLLASMATTKLHIDVIKQEQKNINKRANDILGMNVLTEITYVSDYTAIKYIQYSSKWCKTDTDNIRYTAIVDDPRADF